MRTWIIPLVLLLFVFFIPLQVYVIGDGEGYGIQGAIYRYQVTGYGESLIPLPWEITYITTGIYTGLPALSILLWILGTVLLVQITMTSLIHGDRSTLPAYRRMYLGLLIAAALYLGSCIARYGLFFSGPAGLSLPLGVVILALFSVIFYLYTDVLMKTEKIAH